MAHLNNVIMDVLTQRQNDGDLNGDLDGGCRDGFVQQGNRCIYWWYTRTGVIVKWSLFLGFVLIFGLYLVGGHMHAKRRIRKGLRPLAYHRWLLSRRELAHADPRYAYPQATYTNYQAPGNNQYGMNYMPPPPVYDPNAARPPMYDQSGAPVPDGGSKVDPSQWRTEPTRRPNDGSSDEYAPPPGPPPPAGRNNTGNNPFAG